MSGMPWRTLRWSLCLWGSGVCGGLIIAAGSPWAAVALALASTGLIVMSAVWHDRDEPSPGPLAHRGLAVCTAGPPYTSELVEPQDRCQARSAAAGHHCTLDATHKGAHLCGTRCGRGWVL